MRGADEQTGRLFRCLSADTFDWTFGIDLNTTAVTHIIPNPALFAGQTWRFDGGC